MEKVFGHQIKTVEQLKAFITGQVERAKSLPIKDELYSELEKELTDLVLKQELTPEEEARAEQIADWFNDATIKAETLVDLRMALEELGCDEDYIKYVIEHENAHGNKASSLKANHYGYALTLSYDEAEDFYIVHPLAMINMPSSWSEWRKNRVHIAYTRAPEDYGNELSQNDSDCLIALTRVKANLKKKL